MRALAFIDLDLTLFDYTSARKGATLAALRAMSLDSAAGELYEFANSTLVPHGHLFGELGLPDFRREWKARPLFALLLALGRDKERTAECQAVRSFLLGIEGRGRNEQSYITFGKRQSRYEALLRALPGSPLLALVEDTRTVLDDESSRASLDMAVSAFDSHLSQRPYLREGIADLFAALTELGFSIHVVSEGDQQVQSGKLTALGLDGRIESSFISGACAGSEPLLKWLWETAQSSREKRQPFEVIYNEVLAYSHKSPTFYRKVAHSILAPDPEFYGRFGWLEPGEEVRILVIGDRYDKDLLPAMTAFENVATIRLLAGKYRDQAGDPDLRPPTTTVASLPEAAEFIRSHRQVLTGVASVLRVPAEPKSRIEKVNRSLDRLRLTAGAEEPHVRQLDGLPGAMSGSVIHPAV